MEVEFILYVVNQKVARNFYEKVLDLKPALDVPGMTEFSLGPLVKLGLMPESGIANILKGQTPEPSAGNGIPRCELYLKTGNVDLQYKTAVSAGAKSVSPPADRDWGDRVAYVADPDGHIIAFAETLKK